MPLGFVERQLERRQCGVTQVLIEDRRQVLAGLLVEERDDVLGHDVLVLEVLIESRISFHQRLSSSTTLRSVFRKSAPLKYMSCGGVRWMPRGVMIGAGSAPWTCSR